MLPMRRNVRSLGLTTEIQKKSVQPKGVYTYPEMPLQRPLAPVVIAYLHIQKRTVLVQNGLMVVLQKKNAMSKTESIGLAMGQGRIVPVVVACRVLNLEEQRELNVYQKGLRSLVPVIKLGTRKLGSVKTRRLPLKKDSLVLLKTARQELMTPKVAVFLTGKTQALL